MKWKGYKIPLHRTTKKPTSNNESISKFFDDAVLGLTLDARHYKQAKSYLGEAMVGLDGKIHPLYTTVKTGRLAAKRPNLMNLPQGRGSEIMEEAAAIIRSSFLPDPGYHLVELDWRAIEPTLVGFFANDPDYIRVAKLGSHAFVLSHYLGRPADLGMDDKALGLYLDGLKGGYPTEYKIVKIANNAFNYRQGLYNMARTLGKSVKETKEIRSVIERAFPKIVQWQNTTMMQAHTQGRLTTPFGFSLSFFNVLDKEGAPSREASECLAFLPQSTGAAMLRTILVDLGGHPEEGTTFSLLIPTHDSITAQVRIGEERRILQMMRESMERRWEELGGMSIEVEAKIGPTMGGLEKWKF
jgi:DNA polymerase I-like protein with 3'-5' exonuclease and polymerase domains